MVSFDMFYISEGSPIYMQIIRYIKRGVVSGSISDGDELPSRRVLSALLGVNPNTVQKAYRMLEDEGIIVSRSGSGSCVELNAEKSGRIKREMLESDVISVITAMKQAGASKEEAAALIEKLWD
jgi:GntR family transcriptional regulator